jgi:hypothetical protein
MDYLEDKFGRTCAENLHKCTRGGGTVERQSPRGYIFEWQLKYQRAIDAGEVEENPEGDADMFLEGTGLSADEQNVIRIEVIKRRNEYYINELRRVTPFETGISQVETFNAVGAMVDEYAKYLQPCVNKVVDQETQTSDGEEPCGPDPAQQPVGCDDDWANDVCGPVIIDRLVRLEGGTRMSGDWTGRVTSGQGQAVAVVEIKEVRWTARAGEKAEEDTPQSGARESRFSDAYQAKMKRAQGAVDEWLRVQAREKAKLWGEWRRKRTTGRSCRRKSEEVVERDRAGRPGVSSVE